MKQKHAFKTINFNLVVFYAFNVYHILFFVAGFYEQIRSIEVHMPKHTDIVEMVEVGREQNIIR